MVGRVLIRVMILSAAMLAGLSSAALAQATGAIAGVIPNEPGAVMPGATVEVANTETGQTRSTTSGADGFYTVPQVQPGAYTVKASISGFRPVTRSGISVSVGDT